MTSFYVSPKTLIHKYFLESEEPPDRAHDSVGPENKICQVPLVKPTQKERFEGRGYYYPSQQSQLS